MTKVSLVILNYNGKKYLKNALNSALKQDFKNKEVILVDNNSSDGSVDFVRKEFPKVKIIKNRENFGFGRGITFGIKKSKGEYVAVLNNDIILKKNWVREMMRPLSQKEVIMVASNILFLKKKNLTNFGGGNVTFYGYGYPKNFNKRRIIGKPVDTSYVPGGAMMMKKKIFERIGGFDKKFFLYLEDVDVSIRSRIFGWKVLFVPNAIMYHDYSFGRYLKKFSYLENGRYRTILKNYSFRTILLLLPALIFVELAVIFYSISIGFFLDKLKVYFIIVKDLKSILKQRRSIQSRRKLSDAEVMKNFVGDIFFEKQNIVVEKLMNPILNFYWNLIKKII
jgi:GT2 family glycosyltransferase